ncbi:hypothetical protein [Nocardioides sp. LHG3406-4]|uniref:hypothetical protein n=1 Tax=Nocardioides sp. LHG3406-4 TaxID=2804575 RepID=UPI003CF5CF18
MFNDAGTVIAANALDTAITHIQAHSGARGAAGTSNVIGSRVAVNGTVDADGDIIWVVPFTGLGATVSVAEFSYWTASAAGTCVGGSVRTTGDATSNAAGEYTATIVETSTAS